MKHLRFISVGLSAGIMVCVLLAGCSSSSTHSDPEKAKFLQSLDKHKIHEAIVSHQAEIQGCLNNATDAAGNDGKIALKWTVDGNGGTKGRHRDGIYGWIQASRRLRRKCGQYVELSSFAKRKKNMWLAFRIS